MLEFFDLIVWFWNLESIHVDEVFKEFDPVLFNVKIDLWFFVNFIIGVKFFLKVNDCFVSFIETICESYHNVSLFYQELLITINLRFIFFDLVPLNFKFL